MTCTVKNTAPGYILMDVLNLGLIHTLFT